MSFATEFTYSAYQMNHAAAITPLNGGVVVAFYSGFAECHDTQRVYLLHNEGGKVNGPMPLEPLTGNPVLFSKGSGASIIYTKFEEFPINRVEWWQYCSLWQRDIVYHNGLLHLSDPRQIIVDEGDIPHKPPLGLGYVPRCHPIDFDNGEEILLPLYREHAPEYYGVLLSSKDGGETWAVKGTMGKETCREQPVIQPTLWRSKNGEVLHCLMRNFSGFIGKPMMAKYCQSEDGGETWSAVQDAKNIFNANNSLVACETSANPCLIWNNDPRGRRNLVLGTADGQVIHQIDKYGAYPAVCLASGLGRKRQLEMHVVYSYRAQNEAEGRLVTPGTKMVIRHKSFKAKNVCEVLQ